MSLISPDKEVAGIAFPIELPVVWPCLFDFTECSLLTRLTITYADVIIWVEGRKELETYTTNDHHYNGLLVDASSVILVFGDLAGV